MTKYKVGIAKDYFPKYKHPTGIGEEFFEVVQVEATSRTEAAKMAWELNCGRWLREMTEGYSTTLGRKVSLHVNSPKAGVGGKIGRLTAILVYHSIIGSKV